MEAARGSAADGSERRDETVGRVAGTCYSECRPVTYALGEEVAMFTRNRVHTGRRIIYTENKEAAHMHRKPLSHRSFLPVVWISLVLIALAIPASNGLAQDRGIDSWQRYMRDVSSYDDLQALEDYLGTFDEPEDDFDHRAELDRLLADPIGTLAVAGVPFDAAQWQITVIDMEEGEAAGAIGVSPREDTDLPAHPHCIGVSLDSVAMTIQLTGEATPDISAIDQFFKLLFGVDDAQVKEVLPIMQFVNSKPVDSYVRALWLNDAQPTLLDEFGVRFERHLYRLTAFDKGVADAYAASEVGRPVYNVAGGDDGQVGEDVIGFMFRRVGVLLAQVLP